MQKLNIFEKSNKCAKIYRSLNILFIASEYL
jgi:hypothetical protein